MVGAMAAAYNRELCAGRPHRRSLSSNPWLPLAIIGLLAASYFLPVPPAQSASLRSHRSGGTDATDPAVRYSADLRSHDGQFSVSRRCSLCDRPSTWVLDWRAYLDFVNSRPMLATLAGYSYLSLLPQFALVPMVLLIANQLPHLRQWMLAFGLALIATSAISVFTPAVAAFVYLDLTPQVYANIASTVYTHVPTLEALRCRYSSCDPAR